MPGAAPGTLARLRQQILQLDRAVQIQRALAAGVGGSVEPLPRTVSIAEELALLATAVDRSASLAGRRLEILPPPPGEVMVVDAAMLQHVLTAMALNAVEATPRRRQGPHGRQSSPRPWSRSASGTPGTSRRRTVHRIFQRYFTTRGPGRGNGTWSMKVVGEELLRGEVGFRSSELGGTTFWITLPRRPFAHA